MRSSIFRQFSLALLVLGGCASWVSWSTTYERPNDTRSPYELAQAADLAHFRIDLARITSQLEGRSEGDVRDQLRDWSVLGTLLRAKLDVDSLRMSTWRSAAIRRQYLEDSFLFEYGKGRSTILDDDHVLLFYEKDDRDRTATLARMADTARQRTGNIPKQFLLFEAEFDLPHAQILVERKGEVSGKRLFGPEYGYTERQVTTRQELEAWLSKIDDITFAGETNGVLMLGGRRFATSRTANVDIYDLGVMQQAQAVLAKNARDRDSAVEAIKNDINAKYRATHSRYRPRAYSLPDSLNEALAGTQLGAKIAPAHVPTEDELIAEGQRRIAALETGPTELGFSLDPHWRVPELVSALERYAADPCAVYADARLDQQQSPAEDAGAPSLVGIASGDVFLQGLVLRSFSQTSSDPCKMLKSRYGSKLSSVASALASAAGDQGSARERAVAEAVAPLYTDDLFLSGLVEYLTAKHQMQCARYDGPLRGTRIGMNLFYTDLLAKLWLGLDYHHSAPTIPIPGFVSLPRAPIEKSWDAERQELQHTRLWFGPKRENYVKTADALLFAPIAVRVYAAGSDPAHPGQERQPAEPSRRALFWWDRHFQDIADYEQEYHRQNEIVKWSLIASRYTDKLEFLNDVKPNHDPYVFDSWLAANHDSLRYSHPISLRDPHEWPTDTECLDRLASYSDGPGGGYSGGVTLGGEHALEIASKLSSEAPAALRQILGTEEGAVGSALRTVPKFESGQTIAQLTKTTRARVGGAELHVSAFAESTQVRDARTTAISLSADGKQIGSLVATRDTAGISLSFDSGLVDQAMQLGALEQPARGVPSFQSSSSIQLQGEGQMLLANDGGGAVKFGAAAGKNDAAGALARAGDDAAISFLDRDAAAEKLGAFEWQRLSPASSTTKGVPQAVVRSFVHDGPPAGASAVELRGLENSATFKGFVDAEGALYLERPANGPAQEAWKHFENTAGLTDTDLAAIAGTAEKARGSAVVDVAALDAPVVARMHSALTEGKLSEALAVIQAAEDQQSGHLGKALSQRTLAEARFQSIQGDPVEAGALFRDYEKTYGELSADDKLRAALADIRGGRPADAIAHVGDLDGFAKFLSTQPSDQRWGDLRGWAFARRADASTFFGRSTKDVSLGSFERDVVSVLNVDRPLRGRLMSLDERSSLTPNDAIYIDDYFSLNRHDIESGHGLVAELAVLPDVRFEEVEAAGEASFLPMQIIDSQSSHMTKISSQSHHASRLIRVRSCDLNHDGHVDAEERSAC